ncbi:MAG: hypothetical protein ABSE63_06105 [Thermoguttaceae bacterium]|jgi:hypothetical protein
MADIREIVLAAIRDEDPTATNIKLQLILDDLERNSVYYAEFQSTANPPPDNFFYVLVQSNGKTKLLDDGVRAIELLGTLLEQKKSAIRKLREFWFVEIIAATLALTFTIAYLCASFGSSKVDERLLGVVGIILGYYFGKHDNRKAE